MLYNGDLSPSKLESYARCPMQFYFMNVLKRRIPTNGKMFLGQCVHRAIQEGLHKKNHSAEPYNETNLQTIIAKKYLVEFDNPTDNFGKRQTVVWGDQNPEEEKEKGIGLLQAYFDSGFFSTIPTGESEKPVDFWIRQRFTGETWATQDIAGFEEEMDITDWKIKGRIDYLTNHGAFMDWKTANQSWNEYQAKSNLQFQIYALGLALNTQLLMPDIQVRIDVLVKNKQPKIQSFEFELQKWNHDLTTKKLARILNGIANDVYFPAPNNLCENNCDFRQECQGF